MITISSRKGFTLIEMLVVIAIIAVLVAVIIPVVTTSTAKAKAATDASNLHRVYGIANSAIVENHVDTALVEIRKNQVSCSTFPGAEMWIAYSDPAFVTIVFKDGGNYYDIDYFSEVASKGESSRSTANPAPEATWYKLTA